MYQFSDFQTVQSLPNVTTVQELSDALGFSLPRVRLLIDEVKIPYLQLGRKKIIFKEHLLQALSKKRIFTDVALLSAIVDLPDVFCPKALIKAFRISNGFAYEIVRTPGFPAAYVRNGIMIDKQGLIRWIRANEKNTRKD